MTYEIFIQSVTMLSVQLIFGSLIIWGVFCLFSEGYIFGRIGKFLGEKLPSWIYKPLMGCPPCMSSVYGFAIGAAFYSFTDPQLYILIIALCGLNFIIKSWLYPEYE